MPAAWAELAVPQQYRQYMLPAWAELAVTLQYRQYMPPAWAELAVTQQYRPPALVLLESAAALPS